MLSGLSTVDPRSLYDQMQLEKMKAKTKLHGLNLTDKNEFQRLLKAEVKKRQLKEVSQQLESIFINQMFKAMRKNINKHRLLPENHAENIFNDMLYQEYSLIGWP